MKNKLRISQIGCIISSVAMLISAINLIVSSNTFSITIFLCMIAVLCSNLAIYAEQKKKDDGTK